MIEFKLNDVEEAEYKEFCERHKKCQFSSTIGGKISLEFIPTGLGEVKIVKCKVCRTEKDITDISNW
jgi:hypothetical protein